MSTAPRDRETARTGSRNRPRRGDRETKNKKRVTRSRHNQEKKRLRGGDLSSAGNPIIVRLSSERTETVPSKRDHLWHAADAERKGQKEYSLKKKRPAQRAVL